jgi:formylmethanofuran dehydrogenase subunit E
MCVLLKCKPENVSERVKELINNPIELQKFVKNSNRENPTKSKTCQDCGKVTNKYDGEVFHNNWVCKACADGRWYNSI